MKRVLASSSETDGTKGSHRDVSSLVGGVSVACDLVRAVMFMLSMDVNYGQLATMVAATTTNAPSASKIPIVAEFAGRYKVSRLDTEYIQLGLTSDLFLLLLFFSLPLSFSSFSSFSFPVPS